MVEKVRWAPVEGDSAEILARYNQPLSSLAKGDVPAFVMRQAFNPDDCAGLVQRGRLLCLQGRYDPQGQRGAG